MRDKALWDKLVAYDFGLSGPEFSLSAKLTKATNSSSAQVGQIITEYRKFLYLAAVSDHVVAPSKLIDDVWHIHMLDTRAYLEGLCQGVIGKTIHHLPGRPHFSKDDAYLNTLKLYQEEFGHPPTDRIWPSRKKYRLWFWLNRLFVTAFFASIVISFVTWSAILIVPLLAMAAVGGIFSALYAPLTLRAKSVGDSGGCSGDGGDGCGGGD